MVISLINEENVKQAVSLAETALENCWGKLALLQSHGVSKKEELDALISFQPALLSALVDLEAFYNDVRRFERELIPKKALLQTEAFSKEMQRLARYKDVLDGVIDVGKTLGDAFAWIFYQRNRQLLRKHFEHEFIPRLPPRLGGIGEVEFIRRTPMFGRYFVLSHSITTFLREGDVSLIDPRTLHVAAIGELKTKKQSETEMTVSIFLAKGAKLQKDMLPRASKGPRPTRLQAKFDPQIVSRLKKQIQRIEQVFERQPRNIARDRLGLDLGCAKLQELFEKSSPGYWGKVRADRGLLLVGTKITEPSLVARVTKPGAVRDANYSQQMDEVLQSARQIVDKSLPDNGILIGSMLYHATQRYELALSMRPLFWWPLSLEARKAITFQRMLVMTLYNPAFLIADLRAIGLNVEFKKSGAILISKKYGEGTLRLAGIQYLKGLMQTHLFSEKTIVALIQKAIEEVEKANIKQSTYVHLDFDFVFQ